MEIGQEGPKHLVPPALAVPFVRGQGEQVCDAADGDVVRVDEQHVVLGVGFLRLLDTPDRLRDGQAHDRVEERGRRRPVPRGLEAVKRRAGARRLECPRHRVRADLRRERDVFGRPQLAAVVAQVAAHEDEGVGIDGGARQPAHMPDCVARGVEQIKRAVAEEVDRAEIADLDDVVVVVSFFEADFPDLPASVET